MVLRVEQVLEARVGLEPHVVVAVVLTSDVDRDTCGVLARIQDLQAIRVVHTGLRSTGPAAVRTHGRGGGRHDRARPSRACSQHRHEGEAGQRRKEGTQLNRDRAYGPAPETITCALTSTAR